MVAITKLYIAKSRFKPDHVLRQECHTDVDDCIDGWRLHHGEPSQFLDCPPPSLFLDGKAPSGCWHQSCFVTSVPGSDGLVFPF